MQTTYTLTRRRDNRFWLRLGCGWLRVVEAIDRRAVPAGHEVAVHIDGDPNRAVAHLLPHARDALALLNQQRREGVPAIPHSE